MKGLHTVHAIFKNGALIFADPALVPQDGTEVVVTYFEPPRLRCHMAWIHSVRYEDEARMNA
jgi:hypothetical protein